MRRLDDGIRDGLRIRVALFGLALALPSQNPAAAATENTDPFRSAYGMSFYFDGCGDGALGDVFRRAIQDKVDRCPYSFTTKSEFRAWATERTAQGKAQVQSYIAEHGKLPDRLEGMKTTCAERKASPEYQKLHDQIDRYAKGEIPADAIIAEQCIATYGPAKP